MEKIFLKIHYILINTSFFIIDNNLKILIINIF
jgi:hypothetical protein